MEFFIVFMATCRAWHQHEEGLQHQAEEQAGITQHTIKQIVCRAFQTAEYAMSCLWSALSHRVHVHLFNSGWMTAAAQRTMARTADLTIPKQPLTQSTQSPVIDAPKVDAPVATVAVPLPEMARVRQTWKVDDHLTVSASLPEGYDLGARMQRQCADPVFQERVDDFCLDGGLYAINQNWSSHLKFIPDDPQMISRKTRAELAILAAQVAPLPPEGRPFEYVSMGSGCMRQDLHQILFLLEDSAQADSREITSINISLIDPAYSNQGIGYQGPEWNKDFWMDCLIEFAAIIRLQHPDVYLNIETFSSTEEFDTSKKGNPIDLLTGIRLEVDKDAQLRSDIQRLQAKMHPDAGWLFSDTTKENHVHFKPEAPHSDRQRRINHFRERFSTYTRGRKFGKQWLRR